MTTAIGIVRVSKQGDRDDDSFHSPDTQRARIEAACKANGWKLAAVHEELDVSGGKALEKRPGLSAAVQAVESGKATVVVAAYFDRLFRSMETQAEVVSRVEHGGGQVFALDMGQVTNASAGKWLQAGMLGLVSEYFRRSVTEKSNEGRQRAIESGKAVGVGRMPLGYLRGADGRLVPDPATKDLVAEMFALRAAGGSIAECQRLLSDNGHARVYNAVRNMLGNRIYLGEIRHGELQNLTAHEAIISPEVFRRCQRTPAAPAGRKSKEARLLAKLRILRCGTCGRHLVCDSHSSDGLPRYRCTAHGIECSRKVSIKADSVEAIVTEVVKDAYADAKGSAAPDVEALDQRLSDAQSALDGLISTLTASGLLGEPAAVEALTEAREKRDAALEARDQVEDTITVTLGDWDKLTFSERQTVIRQTIASITVAPGIPGRAGRGRDGERLTIALQ